MKDRTVLLPAGAVPVMAALLAVLLLTACGGSASTRAAEKAGGASAAPESPAVSTEVTVPSAAPAATPAAEEEPDPSVPVPDPGEPESDAAEPPEAEADETAQETDPDAEASPVPTLPRVTKSPTDETVEEGGSCLFLAGYENAEYAVWHFVSPDGQTDMTYEAAQTAFPTMEIRNGMFSNLQLSNIPYAADGWKVYCRYSNTDAGYVDTAMARITVIPVLARQNAQAQTDYPVAQRADFEGNWADTTDGRCQILFTYRDENSLNVGILWRDLSGRRDCWNMTATVYSEGVLVYNDGHYWAEVYSNDNSYAVADETWNGTGSFYFENGRLHWYNAQTGEEVTLRAA